VNQQRISNRDFATSAGLMLAAALSLSFVALFAKQLLTLTDLAIVVFLRFSVPFVILLWMGITPFKKKFSFSQQHWPAHLIRAFFTVSSQYCFLFYLAHGSLLIGTLFFASSGLFLPFISYLCFRAEIKLKTLLSIGISFMGIAFVLNPGDGLNWYIGIGLLAGFLNACSQATVHFCSKRGSIFEVTLIMFALSSVYTFVLILLFGKFDLLVSKLISNSSQSLWFIMIALAIFTVLNQSLRTKAYRYVNKPASLTPFYYMAIVFSALLDWLVYHQVPQWNVYFGIFLILIAAILMLWRKPTSNITH
jgi:drug/metabolite transporter (DMT)-like permease